MTSTAMTPDNRNIIAARSTISGFAEYLKSTDGALNVVATFSPSGTQDVNLTEVGGDAITLGQGTMAASLPVVIASNQSEVSVKGGGSAGTAATGVVTIQGIASMTPVQVSQAIATNLKAQAEVYQGGVAVGAAAPLQVSLANTGGNATPVAVSGTVNPTTPTVLIAFVTTVTTAGTEVQLGSNSIVAGVLQAPSTNTGLIYVGNDNTVSSTNYGAELQPGQATGVAISNTNKIWIDSSVNGDKCAFIGS